MVAIPEWMLAVLADIGDRQLAGAGIRAMQGREGDFTSGGQMLLTGALMTPAGRTQLDEAITARWGQETGRVFPSNAEVVIGTGFSAAAYCGMRVLAGHPKPYVIDQAPARQAGGVFRMSIAPSFWLNSENRAGLPGLPREGAQLNYVPGAPVQPSMISMGEFSSNADMALVIRLALAVNAVVTPGITVTGISEEPYGDGTRAVLTTDAATRLYAQRIIDCRGMGTENSAGLADGDRILTFSQLMRKADDLFPYRGMRNVAVIGGGDSARCAIEALVGIGPQTGMRTMELDGPARIAWYTASRYGTPMDNRSWAESENIRRRYARLGSYLPLVLADTFEYYDSDGEESTNEVSYRTDAYHDVTVYPESGEVRRAGNQVLVNGRFYDYAVLCTGLSLPGIYDETMSSTVITEGGRGLGRLYRSRGYARPVEEARIFQAGPASDLQFDDSDLREEINRFPAMRVAMFRHGGRIAQLAAMLPAVPDYPVNG